MAIFTCTCFVQYTYCNMLFDGESVYLYNRESLTKRCGMDCSEIEYNVVIRVKLHRSWID